jgi:hypothetical protein
MAEQQLYLRMASAAVLLALAFVIVGLDPFLRGDPGIGAGLSSGNPAMSVDRTLKGDRLPLTKSSILYAPNLYAPNWQDEFGTLSQPQSRVQVPIGCDPSFSPITSPAQSNVYGRCMA